MKFRHRAALAPLAAAFVILGVGTASSYDTPEAAAAAGAKICAAAPKSFPLREVIPVATLKARLAELGAPLDGNNLKQVDSSCGMVGMVSGIGAMPILHLGNNNRQDVAMMLQIGTRNGECTALIMNLDGC